MPRYDFLCTSCNITFEKNVPVDQKAMQCARCMRISFRQPAAPNFAIKGFSEKNGYSKEGK